MVYSISKTTLLFSSSNSFRFMLRFRNVLSLGMCGSLLGRHGGAVEPVLEEQCWSCCSTGLVLWAQQKSFYTHDFSRQKKRVVLRCGTGNAITYDEDDEGHRCEPMNDRSDHCRILSH